MNKEAPLNPTWLKAIIADRFSLPFSVCNTFEVQFLEDRVNIFVTKERDLDIFQEAKLEALEKEIGIGMAIVLGVK